MKFAVPIVILLALSVVFALGLGNDPTRIPSPLLDDPVPDFELQTLDDPPRTVTSAELAGRPALLNVWGSWCPNCRDEHGFLLDLQARGIPVFGLNWQDQRGAARAWLDRLGDPYEFSVFDADGRVAIDLGVYGAPETFLLDAKGRIVYKHIGPLSPAVWAAEFAPRLAQLDGAP